MSCENNVCGTGGWSGPKPGDPSNDINISATPAYGGIDINWSYPTTNPFALSYVTVYRGLSNDFNGAFAVGQDTDGFYFDKVGTGITYYYWVQAVSINGTYGDLLGPASASARSSIEQTMRDLTGMIDAGVLAQALKDQIALIPEIDMKILKEIEDRIDAHTALSSVLSAMQTNLDATMTLVAQEVTQRRDGDSALVTSINAIGAKADQNAAAIVTEQTVRASKDSAMASDITTLYAKTGDNKAAIDTEKTVRSDAVSALSTRIDTVFAKADGNTAAINTEATARANADGALSTRIDTLATQAGNNSAAIQTEQTARANADGALSTRIDTAQARADGAHAAVQSESTARADGDGALSKKIDTVQSDLNGQISQVQVTLQTNIDAASTKAGNAQTKADAAAISAGSAQTAAGNAQTTANGANTAAGNAQTTANAAQTKANGLGALYTVKLNVNGLIGGFGTYNDGNTVQMGFDVDSFWVGRTNAQMIKPFIINGGTTYINEAVINTLTFSKLRADDGSVVVANGKLKAQFLQVNTAQSDNYVSGSSGWGIMANGGAEFSGAWIRGASIFSGKAQSPDGSNYIDFTATGNSTFMKVGYNVSINANGSGYFARSVVSAPNILASGTAYGSWVAGGSVLYDSETGYGNVTPYGFSVIIDTGYNVSGTWSKATEDMFLASATIASGSSRNGGITGYSRVELMIGDGLASVYDGSAIDNRVYIKYVFQHNIADSSRSFTATAIDWKLVRV